MTVNYEMFPNVRKIDDVAKNILKKRYFHKGETKFSQVAQRIVDHVIPDYSAEDKQLVYDMLVNRYFLPNSPTIVNSGKPNSGLSACFVVDFKDTIEDIYQTKFDFALIARKGGGCGTTLSKIRPENSIVSGSTHGYAGGPIKFANTISVDMKALTQSGFREMALMFTMSVYHLDILKFITAKTEMGMIDNANMSVTVDDAFMEKVINNEDYTTYFHLRHDLPEFVETIYGETYNAREIFQKIVDGSWKNGEPGILFYSAINDSPYKYSNQEILATNPCVAGDTKIHTVYDGAVSIKELAEKGEDVLVYTWSPESKLPNVRMMRNPRLTRENADLVKVRFDSGLEVKCTPDHSFYTFRGNKIKAEDLRVGQSVRAFSGGLHRDGHVRIHGWVNGNAKHQYRARLIWECFNGKIDGDAILHHKDFNKLNDHLENFQLLSNSVHNMVHYPMRRDGGFFNGGRGRNHKVLSVEPVPNENVYNGTVDDFHTYIIADDNPVAGDFSGIVSANCGEQPLPPNGVCNLGSIDISKFLLGDLSINLEQLEIAVRLSVRLLDSVIDKSAYPTQGISKWVLENRPIGLGIMGLADYYLIRGVAYGSEQSIEELSFMLSFIKNIAEDESVSLGKEKGVPKQCKKLPVPRRNITVLSIAPTGSLSLLAGCSSGIEPVFSEITERKDKTGTYNIEHPFKDEEHFRCAVSSNGSTEVTWKEHILIQATTQKFIDSGVSKTINFPNRTHRDTFYDAFILAWKLKCKGITAYRNDSRLTQVLSPKNIKKDLCPICESELIYESGCKKCSNELCGFSLCTVG